MISICSGIQRAAGITTSRRENFRTSSGDSGDMKTAGTRATEEGREMVAAAPATVRLWDSRRLRRSDQGSFCRAPLTRTIAPVKLSGLMMGINRAMLARAFRLIAAGAPAPIHGGIAVD